MYPVLFVLASRILTGVDFLRMSIRSNLASPVIRCSNARLPAKISRSSCRVQVAGTWNSNPKSRHSLAPRKRPLSPRLSTRSSVHNLHGGRPPPLHGLLVFGPGLDALRPDLGKFPVQRIESLHEGAEPVLRVDDLTFSFSESSRLTRACAMRTSKNCSACMLASNRRATLISL